VIKEVPKIVEKKVIKYVDRPHYVPVAPVTCPSHTVIQSNGTCLQGGYSAPVSPQTHGYESKPHSDHALAGGHHNSAAYCYKGGHKIYDSLGKPIKGNCEAHKK